MTYEQTLDYLYSRLPMFHRIGSAAYKADLVNTVRICTLLKNPELRFRSVHIAGTNGKGSTSHMLSSILQEAGYKTGLYTSPHLKDFRERIRINGKMIPKKFVVNFVETYLKDFEKIKPSFFEWTVGLAFHYFAEMNVDIAIIETGLGGRLDSTNVITPELSVITNISLDHTNLLGDTVKEIAREKAGIIKPGIPVIIGERDNETEKIFLKTAKEKIAPITFAEDLVKTSKAAVLYKATPQLSLLVKNDVYSGMIVSPLAGMYQIKNVKTVIATAAHLSNSGFKITPTNIKRGIWKVTSNTGLLGRWQQLGKNPLIIADTAHNEAGIKEVLKMIRKTEFDNLHFILGMVSDKDTDSILNHLPRSATYYFCSPNIPRAMDSYDLRDKAEASGLTGTVHTSVKKALTAAKKNAGKNDLIFAGGSTFVVAELV